MKRQRNPIDKVGYCHGKHLNLVRKQVHQFRERSDIPYEELFSEATVAYYKALRQYDSNKGGVTTLIYVSIRNHLINYCKKEASKRTYDLPESLEIPINDYFEDKEEIVLSRLSDKSKEFFEVVMESTTVDFSKAPKAIRSAIVKELRQAGWKWVDIWNSFRELKNLLKEL